jgi:hypothetical protein
MRIESRFQVPGSVLSSVIVVLAAFVAAFETVVRFSGSSKTASTRRAQERGTG